MFSKIDEIEKNIKKHRENILLLKQALIVNDYKFIRQEIIDIECFVLQLEKQLSFYSKTLIY